MLTIESKSIPRTGHHLLKRILQEGFANRFSHCERYQEPGCCKSLPCSLSHAYGRNDQDLRLVKSHDFQLSDPFPVPTTNSITLVAYRHPLFSLASSYLLATCERAAQELGLNVKKLNYLHEPAITRWLMDHVEASPGLLSQTDLLDRLSDDAAYQIAFFTKWGHGGDSPLCIWWDSDERVLHVPYEAISCTAGAISLLELFHDLLDSSPEERAAARNLDFSFLRPRAHVLTGRTRIDAFLTASMGLLEESAAEIIARAGLPYPSPTAVEPPDSPDIRGTIGTPARGMLVRRLSASLDEAERQLGIKDRRIDDLEHEVETLRQELAAIRSSRLWRLAGPLRTLRPTGTA